MLVSGLPFLLSPWRAQALGPVGRGEISYFQSGLSIMLAVAAIGARHAYYEARAASDLRLRVTVWPMALASAGVASLVAVPLLLIAVDRMSLIVIVGIVVAWLISPLQVLTQMEVAESQASLRRPRILALTGLPSFVEAMGTLLFLILQKLTIATSVIVTLIAELTRVVASRAFRRRDRLRVGGESLAAPVNLLARGAVLAPVSLLPLLVSNVDSIVLAPFVPIATLGLYAVSKLAFGLLLLTAGTVEGMVIRGERRNRNLVVAVVCLAAVAVVVAAAGYLFTPLLFGSEFEDARLGFLTSSLGGWLGGVGALLSTLIVWGGRARVVLISSVVAAGTTVVGALLLGLLVENPAVWAMGLPAVAGYGVGAAILAGALLSRKRRLV